MQHARLAIIEDEASLREDLIGFFQLKGASVSGYASAEDFFVALNHHTFDLVILDIGLPGVSGIEAAEVIRKKHFTPILILTSHANNKTHIDSLNAGADVFLSKSASLEIIESSVRNMLLRNQVNSRTLPLTNHLNLIEDQLEAEQAVWRLFVRDGVLKAPNHLECKLTFAETQFLNSLLSEHEQTVSRIKVLKVMGKDETLSNLRNLDTYANRLRRKVLEATSVEIPIRSAYNLGYLFSGHGHVLP